MSPGPLCAGPYSPSRRDRRLVASAHDSEATAVPVRVSLLRAAPPGRRAALESGRQDLPAVREAHGRPVRERTVGLPRVTCSAVVVEASVASDTTSYAEAAHRRMRLCDRSGVPSPSVACPPGTGDVRRTDPARQQTAPDLSVPGGSSF